MRFKPTEIVSLAVAALAFAGSGVSALYTYTSRNRELDIRLVEIGIGVLRADPKETGIAGARNWAIQVIENSSNIMFSETDKKALLERPLEVRPINFGSSIRSRRPYAPFQGDHVYLDAPETAEPVPVPVGKPRSP